MTEKRRTQKPGNRKTLDVKISRIPGIGNLELFGSSPKWKSAGRQNPATENAGRIFPETEKRRTQFSAAGIRKRKSAGRRHPQVLRDPRVRREAGGLDTSAEEKKAWPTQLRRVLLKDTKDSQETEAGQVAKTTRPEKFFRLSDSTPTTC